ncbi:hypothetical protein [Rhodanobacter denitrificans]|uniref:Uncharacterized protein n=1 Tax=Rhodanobacter denitrificans TaxID=666685 RepID=M4NDD5_9GAMM|nr:hypothetical protein [Rhodanobacter denitrificans]AGG88765.1 hypothetical protein R2APBS1_1630 [Rhodanobacter denitrificans]UJJ58568.1 hypothetical protein LRK55_00060 [Rhodanobacter denitrificans]UJM87897.1 hypothetical protein LRJ86_06225 [Rhodanobacter denitrificans]
MITRNFQAITESLDLCAPHMDEGGIYPNHRAEVQGWTILVDCYALDAPDAADVWMAVHIIMGLTRIAADRESLNLLRLWLTPGYGGHSTADLIASSMAWSAATRDNRDTTLEVLGELADDVERDADGRPDADQLLAELAEVRAELAELKAERMQPTLSSFDWVLNPTSSMRAFARAVASFVKLYQVRAMDPIDTVQKVAAARAGIAKRVQP